MDITESLTLIIDLDVCLGISLDGWLVVSCTDNLVDE